LFHRPDRASGVREGRLGATDRRDSSPSAGPLAVTGLALYPLIDAISPGLVALGLCLAFLPWLDRASGAGRVIMVGVAIVLTLRYLAWRLTCTLPPAGATIDFLAGSAFAIIEGLSLLSALASLSFLSRSRSRTGEADDNSSWHDGRERPPLVDVLICTYNEEQSILERTIIGAMGMDYRAFRTWILDDGRRPWLQELCERLGCGYITRPDNNHAKAGNINHALAKIGALPEPPEFVSILDADFVPKPHFLSRALALFHDPGVGVVQTPQHFINADPIQANLSAARVWPDEQRFFFDVVMPAKDAWSCAFCCGTSSLIRFEPLSSIGGFPTDSVTEDYLLTLRLREAGFSTVYLNEALTLGLAPEGIKEYITQRGRWCLGFMQIIRGRSGPLSRQSSLPFLARLSLVSDFLNWVAVYPVKLFGLALPILYLLFDIRAIYADLSDVARYFLPYYIWLSFVISWVSRGRILPIMSDVCQLVAAPAIVRAAAIGLLKPQGHKFRVTAKGGDRNRRFVEWPLFKLYATLLALTIASIGYSFYIHVSGESIVYSTLALGWAWYNVIILLITCIVCIEQPRRRKAERFEADDILILRSGGEHHRRRLLDISITGARLRGRAPECAGGKFECQLGKHVVDATLVRADDTSFAVEFDAALASRVALVRHFYAGNYFKGMQDVKALDVARIVLSRVFQ
jgi:cellulose synthase (UDP-forming)